MCTIIEGGLLLLLLLLMRESVLRVYSMENSVTVELCSQSGTEKEGPGEFPMERVALLGRRGETMVQEDGDQLLNPQRRLLSTEIKWTVVFERLSQDE